MREIIIDLSKAKLIIQEESTDNQPQTNRQYQRQAKTQSPEQSYTTTTGYHQRTSNTPSNKQYQGDNTPMSAQQIEEKLENFLDGEVNGITFKKARAWAFNISNNPTLSNPQKIGFLTLIDSKFNSKFLKDFESQHQNDDYIPFP